METKVTTKDGEVLEKISETELAITPATIDPVVYDIESLKKTIKDCDDKIQDYQNRITERQKQKDDTQALLDKAALVGFDITV